MSDLRFGVTNVQFARLMLVLPRLQRFSITLKEQRAKIKMILALVNNLTAPC
ncbi:hypothetical protein ACEQPO_20330 [Bacillus sp. SL00103]